LFTLDVDELLVILEKVESFVSLSEILDKPKVPKQKIESLHILALFDKLLNSGFKMKSINVKRFEILNLFNPPYRKADLNDKDFLTPHFRFIEEFLPSGPDDKQSEFLQELILRKIDMKH